MRLEGLATGEFLAAQIAAVFALVVVRFGVTVAVAQIGERFAADGALERLFFGVGALVGYQMALPVETHIADVALGSEFPLMCLLNKVLSKLNLASISPSSFCD